jgi:hypothetical protein
MRVLQVTLCAAVLAAAPGGPAAAGPPVTVQVDVDPAEGTVGDRLTMRLVVAVPEGTRFDPPSLGGSLGPFAVAEGRWSGPAAAADGARAWTWTGAVSAYRTGDLAIPSVHLTLSGDGGASTLVASDPVPVRIASVLEPEELAAADAPIADLKPPASVPPDYRALAVAAAIFVVLLAAGGVVAWLRRRYAARLAAVPAPADPFHRTPPHDWVYAELQKLLERRLAEQGRVGEFFDELTRILKQYLSGRYRVDLRERTTAEVPARLRQAGAPQASIRNVEDLLARGDLVKFAREAADSADCRRAIAAAYDLVDATRPAGRRTAREERGAA